MGWKDDKAFVAWMIGKGFATFDPATKRATAHLSDSSVSYMHMAWKGAIDCLGSLRFVGCDGPQEWWEIELDTLSQQTSGQNGGRRWPEPR